MLRSIMDDMKREFSYGNMVTRIIIVNVAVFVILNLLYLFLWLGNGGDTPAFYVAFKRFFMLPADGWELITHPWSIITHMFLHEGFFHILWNMLLMYWFGRIVGDFIGNQRILPLYLLGGLVGAVFFLLSANFLPNIVSGQYALGASAGVMAIIVAAGAIAPDYIMRLLFLGDVKLKYIVAVLIFLDLIAIPAQQNTGGHMAHLGGAALGFLFVRQLQQGTDLSRPVNNFMDSMSDLFGNLFNRNQNRRGPKVAYKNPNAGRRTRPGSSRGDASSDNKPNSDYQERLDAILDKIKQDGYDTLTEEEKEFLFNASKK